jgi:hypothetical protein
MTAGTAYPNIRFQIVADHDPDYSYMEQEEFATDRDREMISFGLLMERRCECCGTWDEVDSCWGYDFFADSDYPDRGIYTVEKFQSGPFAWMGEGWAVEEAAQGQKLIHESVYSEIYGHNVTIAKWVDA